MRSRLIVATFALVVVGASSLAGQTAGIREVSASARSLVTLDTKLRYTTMILLPDDEEILEVICGDRDFWVISASDNIAHVKPAKEGAATNLNLVTTSGTVYSFLLREGRAPQPDLKVYVTPDPAMPKPERKYVPVSHVSALQTELTEAQAAIELARRRADEEISSFRQEYPSSLRFAYATPKYEKPFFVRSIWHDGQFTYVRSDARELPTLYEVIDGKPALVNFQVQQGTYVIPKVLERGYLALGRDRFTFETQGR